MPWTRIKAKPKEKPEAETVQEQPDPQPPSDASAVNLANSLHTVPRSRRDFDRYWILYDWIDPAPRFKRMGPEHDSLSPNTPADIEMVDSGEETDGLEGDVRNLAPVSIKGYE